MMSTSFDWQALVGENVDQNNLLWNIRQIYDRKSRTPPEVLLTLNDEKYLVSVCHRAVQPQLSELFQSISAPEKLIILVQNYITTVNSLTATIFDENESANLKFESALLHKLKLKLQLRNEFLKSGWPTEDENSDKLIDSICKSYTILSSFRSISYKTLASDYISQATNIQKEILQNLWMNENDLRTKIKQYNLSLSLVDTLEAQNVRQLDDLTDDVLRTCVQTDEIEMKQKLSSVKDNLATSNVICNEHNRFKANLTNMIKNEGRQGKQKREQREKELKERKQRTEEAIQNIEDINEKLNGLTTNSKNQLATKLNEIASKLQVTWQFTEEELNKPDVLLKEILNELNKVNEQFNKGLCTAYKSDEDIVENISGGIVRYGIQLSDPKRLGEKSQRPLLSRPTFCPLNSPSLPFQSTQHKFTSLEASNKFTKTIESSGLTVAAYLEASGWVGGHAKASFSHSSQNTSTSTNQNKTQSTMAIQIDYTVIPMKCFRIPREEMKLSIEAENALASVNNLQKAKEFLREFHSHVSDGMQHIGGIFMRIVTVETQEETDLQSLEAIAAKTMNTLSDASRSFPGFDVGAGVSVESFETNATNQGNQNVKRTATVTRKIQCIGPPCSNSELFMQALNSNNSSWYVIDRDALSSFIPIWEIVLKQYSSQSYMIDAAKLLKRAWLSEAHDYESSSVLQLEIQRVRFADYISNDGTLPVLIHILTNVNDKNNFNMLEENIKVYLDSCNISDLSSSTLMNRIISLFQSITVCSNNCREDFLTMLLQRDTMKSFLKSLALCPDNEKVRHILPVLGLIFSTEKMQDLYQKQVELEPEILILIQKYHKNKQDDKNSYENIFNIPTIPLHRLSSYLENLMVEKVETLTNFTTDISLIISKSLKNAVKTNEEKYVQDVKNVLNRYGWSNCMDEFPTALTRDGFLSLFAAINDMFQKDQTQVPVSPTSTVPVMYADYNTSTNDNNKSQKLLYNYTSWIVDRPVAPISQPIQRFMDILRHRLEITSFVLPSATSVANEPSQSVRKWGKKQVISATSITPASVVQPLSSCYQTVYDILIHILHYSDILSQIELFRLLVERRTAVPILIPSLDSNAPPYTYLMNALSFVNTKLSRQREYNFANDRSLLRIAILSMRSLKDSENSEWIKQVFFCHSLVSLSSTDIQSICTNQCIAEIGLGFIPCLPSVGSENYQEVLLLHVMGNYSSIGPYIHQFADVLMVEENPSTGTSFQPWSSLHDDCYVIIWKTATQKTEPVFTDDGYCHLSSTVIQTVNIIHDLLLKLLQDESQTEPRSLLKSLVHPDLYASVSINLIDTEKIVQGQDFSVVRRQELPLQQLFIKESDNIILKSKNRNHDAEQERIQRLIDDYRKQRDQEAYTVEKHLLIQCFTGVLSLENRQLRMLTIHQLTQQIEFYSRSAMKALIHQKNEAFNEYDRDQQNRAKQEAYFKSKRLFVESTIEIEHLWREVCHLYASHPIRYENYPALAAKHLIDGFTLELLDGDAGMLEQTWIKAVFSQLEQQLKEPRSAELNQQPIRILILSVLGVQSTGKSTLLNFSFGARLHTSAGKCTRGVHIQLLKAENRKEYDYILLLDTEGIRAPEHGASTDSTWRDNRLATFAILPADATIILINSEDDSAAREVLPIVMLAYEQSELAASSTAQLSTRIFFVYTRVDMNDTKKLVNNIQEMFIDITNNTMKLQRSNKGHDQKANQFLFRDFRVKAENDDIGGNESDIKFLGKLKKSDAPPDDVPDADYGKSIVKLIEYIYNRIVSKTSDGQHWKARTLGSFASYLDSIWQCILSADFTLSFKSIMERMMYDKLQAYCIKQRTKLAHLFSTKYDEIEKNINDEQLPDQQKITEQQEKKMCEDKIRQYQLQFSQMVEIQANQINKEVLQELDDEHYQQWYTGSKDGWMAFYNNLKGQNNSRIRQLVTNRITYDSKLICYQQQIRKNITNSFEKKHNEDRKELLQNEAQQQEEFKNIFYDIVADAKKNHPPEKIESNIQQLYEHNGIGCDCDYRSKYKERSLQPKPIPILDSMTSCFNSKISHKNNNSENPRQQKLVCELVSYVEDLLTPIKHYSDHTVQEAIDYACKQLEENNTNRKTLQELAHQTVYTLLVERLTEKQREWERTNSISARLEAEHENLWNFYCNTIKGIVGVELLTSDLKLILMRNYRIGLQQKVVPFVVLNLHKEAWIMDSRMLMAHADLDLLELINTEKIDEVIHKVTNSSEHYQEIVNRLIQQNITNCVKHQLYDYHNSLKLVFRDTVLKTKLYFNPICDKNEKDEAKICQGRTKFFLKELIRNLKNYHLPVVFADAMRTLNHENYIHCDSEPIEIWEKITKDLLETVPKEGDLKLGEDENQNIIKDVLDKMVNNENNETVKMRCSEPCPICKMACKRDLGHINSSDESVRRHDCDHQPAGLGGIGWEKPERPGYLQLTYKSCSNHLADDNQFEKEGKWYPFKTFANHYPWLTPRLTTEALHEVRQYIFYNYQQQLATHYDLLPCSDIPSTFNHQLSALKLSLTKIINENSLK